MKTRSFAFALFRTYRKNLAANRRFYFYLTAGMFALAIMLLPVDRTVHEALLLPKTPTTKATANVISDFGDFWGLPVILGITFWGLGTVMKRPNWKRIALVCLIGSATAGIAVNCLRVNFGRPRPSADYPDGFYGPSASHKFHSFPSGHTAAAFGGAAPLMMINPVAGTAVVTFAASVGWSRMQLKCHYLSDVIIGAWLGLMIGLPFGRACRIAITQADAIEAVPVKSQPARQPVPVSAATSTGYSLEKV